MDEFQRFYNDTKVRFFNFLVRMTGDADRAADAFQESYARYWEHYGQKPPDAGLLFTIGRNIALDGHRRKQRQQPLDEAGQDARPDQETVIIIKEEYRNMLAAMGKLETVDRELLSLAADGGLRYEQIAQITHLSIANIKVKIHRARQKLRRYLDEA